MYNVAQLFIYTWFPLNDNVVDLIGYFNANLSKVGSMEKVQTVRTSTWS